MMGRLKPGSSALQAQAELDTAMDDLARAYPEATPRCAGTSCRSGKRRAARRGCSSTRCSCCRGILLLLLLAVCGNTANLLLARVTRASARSASASPSAPAPRRIVRLLVTESLVVAVPGAALGALIAVWGTQALRNVPIYSGLPVKFQTEVDWMGLAFASALAIACAVAFGAAPAVQLARLDPHVALKTGARAVSRNRLRTCSWRRKWRSPWRS